MPNKWKKEVDGKVERNYINNFLIKKENEIYIQECNSLEWSLIRLVEDIQRKLLDSLEKNVPNDIENGINKIRLNLGYTVNYLYNAYDYDSYKSLYDETILKYKRYEELYLLLIS